MDYTKDTTKLELIKKYVKKSYSVLDVGCVGDRNDSYVFDFLEKNSKKVVGIDYNKKGILLMQKKGKNVLNINAEELYKLGNKKFDCICAFDLIEHLNNPGVFVKDCSHLSNKLLLSTNNAFGLNNFIVVLLKGEQKQHIEHMAYYEEETITHLLNYFGYSVKVIRYTPINGGLGSRILCRFVGLIGCLRPRFHTHMFIVANKKRI